jgi:hypothetical protein
MPPAWFDDQLTIFAEAVRLAAVGDVASARVQIRSIRSEELQTWYIEHGQQSGVFRNRHFGRSNPAVADTVAVALDPIRSPEKLATAVFKRDGYRCRYCGVRLVPLHVLKAFGKAVG